MRNQAWFDFIMKKGHMTQYYVVAIFNLYGKVKEWHISSNTINNDEVKKSVVVFKLGRGFMMGVVKPRVRFGTPFF